MNHPQAPHPTRWRGFGMCGVSMDHWLAVVLCLLGLCVVVALAFIALVKRG